MTFRFPELTTTYCAALSAGDVVARNHLDAALMRFSEDLERAMFAMHEREELTKKSEQREPKQCALF